MTQYVKTLAEKYALSDEQRSGFTADGHILLRSALSPDEITTYQPVIETASKRLNIETRSLSQRDTYGKAFLQITNLWTHDAVVREFVFARKFAQIAADLLGVKKVRLYHDQALIKEPGGGRTPWHQDQYYWPLDTDRTVTMWMPLVDIDEAMGMLTFASGSHKRGAVRSIEISDESEEVYNAYILENGFTITKADSMKAGDATFHLGWTIHSAGANRSETNMRQVMTIIYFADGTRVTVPQNEDQAADLETWLGDRSPGEMAAGRLNPVLN